MKPVIAIIGGTGDMGNGLAYRWAQAGYPVIIGSRKQERAVASAESLKERVPNAEISGQDNASAASNAEIVLLTMPYEHRDATIKEIRDSVTGKLVIDATVPLKPPKVARVQLPECGSAVVETQRLLGKEVQLVSAFQNVGAHNLLHDMPIQCDVLVTGDEPEARERVIELAKDAGITAWHAGPLANSAAAEALTSVLIHINKRYKFPGAGIKITSGKANDTD